MNAYELADKVDFEPYGTYGEQAANMLRKQADRIAELEKQLNTPKTYVFDGKQVWDTTPQIKELSDIDLTLILEVLIDSYDDTNRCYLEYKAMWEKSPTRKARIDGMKRMVYKHANAIEKIEAILKKASEK